MRRYKRIIGISLLIAIFLCSACSKQIEKGREDQILAFCQVRTQVGFSMIRADGTILGSESFLGLDVERKIYMSKDWMMWESEQDGLWMAGLREGEVEVTCLAEEKEEWQEWEDQYEVLKMLEHQGKIYWVEEERDGN